MKFIIDERLEFDLLGGDKCMWCRVPVDRIQRVPLALQCGELPPGAMVTYMGGKKTAAGFTVIRMHDGHALEYLGTITNLDGVLAVFRKSPEASPAEIEWPVFWVHSSGLMHFTNALAGRVIETSQWKWTTPPTKSS